ncbi:hypothetical protein GOBAR_AA14800 [Gossypium barbadense]|uniref:Pectate lyase n=1 Tax=Gossypium barbadense TaxID=3634 RepID=A0A2P5XR86_GOSBA|nr:hypothetical protein GOBAR_AA14800 [Gossypium barbadense]
MMVVFHADQARVPQFGIVACLSYPIKLVFVVIFVLIPTLRAHIAEYDEYWKAQELEAIENLNKAYHPNPEEVVRHYNDHFARTMLEKRLADCAPGFASGTTGGKDGKFYVVTDPSDDSANPKPGTLRHAVTQLKPLWIIFRKSMIIKLEQELIVTSDKTIDARGANVHICYGAGITVQFAKNIIIHGLHIHHIKPTTGGIIRDAENHLGLRTASDGDGISLFGATNIWLDHLSLYDSSDGLIDVLLFGASDTYVADEKMHITVALNLFGKGLVDRMPRCRLGFFHVVNNDYTHWFMYAIGGSSHPTIISQGNRYIASSIYGDHFMNGAYFTTSGDPNASKLFDADKMMYFQPGRLVPRLTRYAGTLHCRIGRPC